MYVRIYVCMYVCMYVRMYVCMVYALCMYVYLYIYIHTYTLENYSFYLTEVALTIRLNKKVLISSLRINSSHEIGAP